MVLMSQLLEKLSPPYLEVGTITTGASEWKITLEQYNDPEHSNAYKVNFEIPWDSESKALLGPTGEKGDAATIRIGSVTSGSQFSVKNSGTNHNAVLDFVLPKGIKGERGEQGLRGEKGAKGDAGPAGAEGKPAVVKIGQITYANDGLVHIQARNEKHADRNETLLDFYFPRAIMNGGAGYDGKDGEDATVEVGNVSVGDVPNVTNKGTPQHAIFDFVLPRGDKGEPGTPGSTGPTGAQGPKGDKGEPGKDGKDAEPIIPDIRIGDVKTAVAGSEAEVFANCTKDGRIVRLDFTIPRGFDGATGEAGQSVGGNFASVSVGRVTSGDFPNVVNVGTSENAVLDFVLPRGERGPQGPIGLTGEQGPQGPRGLKGDKGDIGPTGPQGQTGAAATIRIGNVSVGDNPSVRNVGSDRDAILEFILPKGNSSSGDSGSATGEVSARNVLFTDGQTLQYKLEHKTIGAAVFSEGVNTTTIDAGTNARANLTGEGTPQNPYTLNLEIPRGAAGTKGDTGKSGTVKIGNVKQLGEKVIITNSGTPEAAVLNFIFPESWGAQKDMPISSDKKGNIILSQANLLPTTAGEGLIGNANYPFSGGAFLHLTVAGKNIRQQEVFTSGGTFTVPNGVKLIWISACAGGGGGALGCGGGGGESIYRQAFNVTSGQKISINVGSGGQGCTSIVNKTNFVWTDRSGSNGGNTVIGTLITLRGGRGGVCSKDSKIYPGEAGGKGASGGNYLSQCINAGNVQNVGSDRQFFVGGNGGNSMFGTGGTGGSISFIEENLDGKKFDGGAGVGFGGGGGGGAWVSQGEFSFTTRGGAGAPGFVMIEWE